MKGWGGNPVLASCSLIKELLLFGIGAIRKVPNGSRASRPGTPRGFHWHSLRFSCQIMCVLSFQHNLSASGNNFILKKSLWFWVAISVCKSWCCPCLNFYMLLHVLYFVSIMLFFPISLLLPHSEPGYDWWWGEILVCCCGESCDHRVAAYRLICRFTFLVLWCCVANPLVQAEHADVTGSSLLVLSSPLLSAKSFQGHSKLQFLQYAARRRRVSIRANPPGQASAALSSCWR